MISLLHSLHARAAQRGDGLHPELYKRMTDMDTKFTQLNATASELQRRRSLAQARQERESARKSLIGKLMETERQADQLRAWITRQEPRLKPQADDIATRMLQWASDELAMLEALMAPEQLREMLCQENLFPDVDQLADPLGDPPPSQPWGR